MLNPIGTSLRTTQKATTIQNDAFEKFTIKFLRKNKLIKPVILYNYKYTEI